MASLRDELAADYAEAVSAYEQTFFWEGEEYPCVRTTAAAQMSVVDGGFEEGISDRVTVSLADLPGGSLPVQGDLIDDDYLQIQKVDRNIGHLVLWCAPVQNMGANY